MGEVHRIGFTQLSDANDSPNKPYKVNVVFVHGLRGHPERTWTSGHEAYGKPQPVKSKRRRFSKLFHWDEGTSSDGTERCGEVPRGQVFWPRDFLVQDLPDARIWTYGYNADVIGGLFQSNNQNSISQHGRDLATKIERDIEHKEPIVFVAHSFGGLLVKDALGRPNGLHLRTSSILFLGTPHRGSSYAEWGQIAANLTFLVLQDANKNILRGLEVNSEVLDNIHERFTNIVAGCKIKIYSFQEARGISGMKGLHNKVVDDYSSKLGLPSELEIVQSIDANHREMARCKNRNDPQYRDILSVLSHITRHISMETLELACEASVPSTLLPNMSEPETVHTTGKVIYSPGDVRRNRDRCNSLLGRLYTLPYEDRKNRNPKRVKGTCRWFTNHPLFQGWQAKQSSALLWVSADPGCGKSVLARYLVDEVLRSSGGGYNAVCYFFFKDDFNDQRNPENALCCILHQIFTQRPTLLSDNILDEFDSKGDNIFTSFSDLWGIFIRLAGDRNAEGIVCVLDALDECGEKGRCRLIEAVCELYDPKANALSPSIKLLLTSRPYVRIQREFWLLENHLPTIHLSGENEAEVEKICREIDLVIKDKVNNLSGQLLLSREGKQLLEDELTRVPHRTYLWVYLVFDVIKGTNCITDDELRTSIRTLPKTVEAAYDKILRRSSDRERAKRLLHIVVAALRPLSLKEMALALAITKDHQAYANLGLQGEDQFRGTVRELCGLFVTIVDSKIYLLHQTAKEFLVKEQASDKLVRLEHEPNTLQWRFSLEPTESHRILLEICVWHLLFKDFETFPVKDEHRVFLDYSAKYWTTHLGQPEINDDAPIQPFLIQLFHMTPGREKMWEIIRNFQLSDCDLFQKPYWALGWASYLGLPIVVRQLLKDVAGINPDRTAPPGTDYNGSAVHWAVRGRISAVVQMLLDHGADTEIKDDVDMTPLLYATIEGDKDIVEMLLAHRAKTEAKDSGGATPLLYAAGSGDKDIVEMLLDHGADIEARHSGGATPLLLAAMKRDKDIVEMLLDHGADIEAGDMKDATSLLYAAELGTKDIVKMLLDHGANTEAKDKRGKTSLFYAVGRRNEDIVQLLLENDVDVDAKNSGGRTALEKAAGMGNDTVIDLLLQKGADPKNMSRFSWKLLAWAILREREDSMRLILLRKGCNIDEDEEDENEYTSLCSAAIMGSEDRMRLLLEQGANVNATRGNGFTALWCSCVGSIMHREQEDIVRLLLLRGANTEVEDEYGRTILRLLVQLPNTENVVRILLSNGANIEARDKNGETPLWGAGKWGQVPMMRLLLEKGAKINARNRRGKTVLQYALVYHPITLSAAQRSAVIELLRQNGAVED